MKTPWTEADWFDIAEVFTTLDDYLIVCRYMYFNFNAQNKEITILCTDMYLDKKKIESTKILKSY
jgi:hypothetical protein